MLPSSDVSSRGDSARWRSATVAATGVIACLLLAAPASGYVYWTDDEAGKIGRAKLNGSAINQSFITLPGSGDLIGLAVDAQHVYWADDVLGAIGRANLDGSGVNQSFIAGANFPAALAVDAQHIYWRNGCCAIGRANLDGSGANLTFINSATPLPGVNKIGLAVDGQHIYWTSTTTGAGDPVNAIGRANLDGSAVNQTFIAGANEPYAVAVDSQHVYWSNRGSDTIGRANLDGSGVDQSLVGGASGIFGIAAGSQHIYWANGSALGSSIGRAGLSGSGVDQSFVDFGGSPVAVAVDALGPGSAFSIVGKRLNRKRGIAVLIVRIFEKGRLVLRGAKIKKQTKKAKAASRFKLVVRPKHRVARKLKSTGKAKVTAKVKFKPVGRKPTTKTTRLTLRRRG